MIKLNVLKKVGNIVNIGEYETNNVEFARQLTEKGLAELIEGTIPEKEKRIKQTYKINKKSKNKDKN